MSSMTLIASRTPPSGSRTAVALIRAQRTSPVARSRARIDDRLGIEPGQREPPGQPREVERAAAVVDHLEVARRYVAVEKSSQRLAARDAVERAARLVGVDQLVVGRLDGDRVGDAVEHHAQLVGEQARAPARPLERRHVLEGHHGDPAPAAERDRRAGDEHGAHAVRRVPVDLDVLAASRRARRARPGISSGPSSAPGRVVQPVGPRVVLRRHAERQRAAGEPVRGGVGVERSARCPARPGSAARAGRRGSARRRGRRHGRRAGSDSPVNGAYASRAAQARPSASYSRRKPSNRRRWPSSSRRIAITMSLVTGSTSSVASMIAL